MYCNLMAKPGDKVLVIGEILESLGVMEELRKRIGETGQTVYLDMIGDEECDFKDWPEKRKRYMDLGVGEEWPYDFADGYPDNYFDLIFLPQGVHHGSNWLRDAPRLLRALKPGHQIMAIECGVDRPEFFIAKELSAQVRIIIDRLFEFMVPPIWARTKESIKLPPECVHEGRPGHDVSTAHLRQAFSDSLADVISIEWKGWILFWGYKK